MATNSIDHSARIIALPIAAALPVVNLMHRGRYPEMVVPGYKLRIARRDRLALPAEVAAPSVDPILAALAALGPAREKVWRARIALAVAEMEWAADE